MVHNYFYIIKTRNTEFTFRTYNTYFNATVAVSLLADGAYKIKNFTAFIGLNT
jgi:hypothetical protein